MNKNEIMEMTKELGLAIKGSPQMENMNKCEAELQSNAEAKMLMNDYVFTHRQFMEASNNNKDREMLEDIHKQLTEKQEQLDKNEITRNYLNASDAFNNLIQEVNQVLVGAIRDEDGCSSDGCSSDSCSSGGCSSCSSCG